MSKKPINEFRKDPISGDWVLFATGRAKRLTSPGRKEKTFSLAGTSPKDVSPACPFDDPQASGQDIIGEHHLPNGDPWVTIITNKYPAVKPGSCGPIEQHGPISFTEANGFHEVLITRDHQRGFPQFSVEETRAFLLACQDRYRQIARYECGEYIQIFNNSGAEAGASMAHPHSQILSTPILPPAVARSLNGSAGFYLKHQQTAHKFLLDWEREEKQRIIFEDRLSVAYCPYVSRKPYEIRVMPLQQQAHFEKASEDEIGNVAEALRFVLSGLNRVFPGISFNFFIHTSPVREDKLFPFPCSVFYHWHIEIIPHVATLGGFDFSTGIIVNIIDPDEAARALREA